MLQTSTSGHNVIKLESKSKTQKQKGLSTWKLKGLVLNNSCDKRNINRNLKISEK